MRRGGSNVCYSEPVSGCVVLMRPALGQKSSRAQQRFLTATVTDPQMGAAGDGSSSMWVLRFSLTVEFENQRTCMFTGKLVIWGQKG